MNINNKNDKERLEEAGSKDFFILNDEKDNNPTQIYDKRRENAVSFLYFINMFHEQFGYSFTDLSLIKTVFMHSSYDANDNNSRLETLGDSIISMFVVTKLFKLNSKLSSGTMSKIKAFLVSKNVLGSMANELKLSNFLRSNIHLSMTDSNTKDDISQYIKCSLFEALVGAIFIDTNENYEVLFNILDNIFRRFLNKILNNHEIYDYKSFLQTMCIQQFKKTPNYEVIRNNNKKFMVKMFIDQQILAIGEGKNTRIAEKHCAIKVCKLFKWNIEDYYYTSDFSKTDLIKIFENSEFWIKNY